MDVEEGSAGKREKEEAGEDEDEKLEVELRRHLRPRRILSKPRRVHLVRLCHAHAKAPRFPVTVAGLRKYKRPVPPRFGLSLMEPNLGLAMEMEGKQEQEEEEEKQSEEDKEGGPPLMVRRMSEIPKVIRRNPSEGWEEHQHVLNIDSLLETIFASRLHNYQKRTLLWARHVEAEVREGVGYRVPAEMSRMPGAKDSPVLFNWWDAEIGINPGDGSKTMTFGFKGGVIANEMGLGKTLTTLAMVLLERHRRIDAESKGLIPKLDKDTLLSNRIPTNCTLIVCPSHLAQQWKQEVDKHIRPDYPFPPKIHLATTMPQFKKLNVKKIQEADVIVVSIQLLLNYNYHIAAKLHIKCDIETRNERMDELARAQSGSSFGAFHWGRLILDEGHELFSPTMIQKHKTLVIDTLMCIKSTTRWYLTGTPFTDPILTPRGAFRFLQASLNGGLVMEVEHDQDVEMLYNIASRSDKDSSVRLENTILHTRLGDFLDRILFSRLFCRYTKAGVKDAYEIPDYHTEIVRLAMHPVERIIYEMAEREEEGLNDLRLRKICGHPDMNSYTGKFRSMSSCLFDVLDKKIREYQCAHTTYENILSSIAESRIILRDGARVGARWGSGGRRPLTEEEKVVVQKSIRRFERVKARAQFQMEQAKPYILMMFPLAKTYGLKDFNMRMYRATNAKKRIEELIGKEIEPRQFAALYTSECPHPHSPKLPPPKLGLIEESWDAFAESPGAQRLKNHKEAKSNRGAFTEEELLQMPRDRRTQALVDRRAMSPFCNGRNLFLDQGWSPMNASYELRGKFKGYPDFEAPEPYDAKKVETEEAMHTKIVEEYGSKIGYIIGKLTILLSDKSARVIVFSQWSKLFEAIQSALAEYGIGFVLCKGNVHMRTNAIKNFNTKANCKVIMLSLESAASGANLQRASHVILLDPCAGTKEEADAIEAQAIGRAHRQGQKKKLTVIRVVMKDTIEERLLERKEETLEWRVESG